LALAWKSWSVTVAALYTVFSVTEYFILLSAVQDSPVVRKIAALLGTKIH
jgi:hypothetical protein